MLEKIADFKLKEIDLEKIQEEKIKSQYDEFHSTDNMCNVLREVSSIPLNILLYVRKELDMLDQSDITKLMDSNLAPGFMFATVMSILLTLHSANNIKINGLKHNDIEGHMNEENKIEYTKYNEKITQQFKELHNKYLMNVMGKIIKEKGKAIITFSGQSYTNMIFYMSLYVLIQFITDNKLEIVK